MYFFFIMPAFLMYTFFFIIPNMASIVLSFFSWNGISSNIVWVALDNFKRLFTVEKIFLIALKNNVFITLFSLTIQVVAALFLAMLLYKNNRFNTIFKTIFFFPMVLSMVAVSFIWIFMFDTNLGVINDVLHRTGLGNLSRSWLGEPNLVILSICIVQMWRITGYSMIIFIAGLIGIPQVFFEVSRIEGASWFQNLFHVILPSIMHAFVIVIILNTIWSFQTFALVYTMTGGGPGYYSEVLATTIYKFAFNYNEVGLASSTATILMLTIAVITTLQHTVLNRYITKNI